MPILSLRDPLGDDPFLPESTHLRRSEKSEGTRNEPEKRFGAAHHYVAVRPNRTAHATDLREGLGRLPTELESISSLLLFNTQDNPYKKYVSLDNLAGKEVAAPVQDKKSLADAPTTLGTDDLPHVRSPTLLSLHVLRLTNGRTRATAHAHNRTRTHR
jgi:hypothetical protein